MRERITPLNGPLPCLRRCIETEKNTRLLYASSMQANRMTLEEAMKENDTNMIAFWDWTQASVNLNVTEVQQPQQDVAAFLNSLASTQSYAASSSAGIMVPFPPPAPIR